LTPIQRRQCLVGASELLAQLLGRSERTVPPMRRAIGPLAGRLEAGNHRDTPAQQPAKLLLRLAPQAADIAEGLGIVALFLADPFPEGGLPTSHRTAAPLGPCQPQHSILTSMTASGRGPLMDEEPSTPKLSRRSPAAAPGWSAARLVRAAARVPFAIAGRTGAQRCYGARQRCGDPGPDPLGERPLGHAPGVPGSAISLLTCALAAVPSVTARRCPERLTARSLVLLAARMLARYKFLYSISSSYTAFQGRPCGRPPAAAVLGRQAPDSSGAAGRTL
jgi:hypothetical protein